MSLQTLPPELGPEILIHLPVDKNLVEVGLASKHLFYPLIFNSFPFALKHVLHQCEAFNEESLWQYLEIADMESIHWPHLPLPYQAAIYAELICDPPPYMGEEPSAYMLTNQRAYLVFDVLLQHGFNPSVCDNRALGWASYNGHTEVVERLLTYPDVFPNSLALEDAACNNHATILRMLLAKATDDALSDTDFDQLFLVAITSRYHEIVRLLLTVPSVTPPPDVLDIACDVVDLDILELLLKDGRAQPSEMDFSPMFQPERRDFVALLLKDGRLSEQNLHASLKAASTCGWTECVELALLDERADPSRSLPRAIKKGHLEVVQMLWNDSRTSVRAKEAADWLASAKTHSFNAIASFLESKLREMEG
ncbi:hypothetical protein BCR33DRAFT_716715 [Rhizoclosmatium globosum]|uniref:Ankyrin n=1 Tax=Rhizoclosmatium globosum TaxID=329046 RepID=A0A1Y2CCJ2_9FUNG|nr:hypothetical protein BCR33DRAFT_716715 [Rhizoclosmatium globosum]|eukprot:ORY44753.1 hypothetical protein BCR33DRAFT_716715 [Rhizoclosmatium globosum]